MEFTELEAAKVKAVECELAEKAVIELGELQLATVGGGNGDIQSG